MLKNFFKNDVIRFDFAPFSKAMPTFRLLGLILAFSLATATLQAEVVHTQDLPKSSQMTENQENTISYKQTTEGQKLTSPQIEDWVQNLKENISLKISTSKEKFMLGEDIAVNIELTNSLKDQSIYFLKNRRLPSNTAYFHVTNDEDQPIPFTLKGKFFYQTLRTVSYKSIEIPPQKKNTETIVIDNIFKMDEPGVYHIYAGKTLVEGPFYPKGIPPVIPITSNVIKVVLEKSNLTDYDD